MEITNSNILQRMQSKVVSKPMFDFDTLAARPLLSLLDYSDLDRLYNIASSVRYSGDIHKKLNAIRDVMHNRGFRKLGQGTNRIVYSYFEDPSIVLKIATDKVGMKDNPAEFINQNYLKPFVTKVFEVTPDGVVGEFERVQPITSREEFLSCSDHIFEILNLITEKYIMADVGARYFMNWGIAQRTDTSNMGGPVLLDFSYLYEPDGGKLMCCAPNPNEPLGICGGWIDYDQGFNELKCLKCGCIYKAKELAKDEENNKIIRKGRKSKMKVKVNYKGNVNAKEINLDGQLGNNGAFKTPTNIVRGKVATEPIGKLRIATPVLGKKVVKESLTVTEDKIEKVEEPKVEEAKTIADPATALDTIEKLENEIHKPQPSRQENKPETDTKKSIKVKITNQDGTVTEKAVKTHSDESNEHKGGIKLNRHYKNNYGENMPRRSQVQLTAITFEQLKELDFKYSSTDLEFHKMFFRAEHTHSNPSVMVDFDSIPKDKLELILGVDFAEIDSVKDELEKTKSDLTEAEEALITVRKINNDYKANIDELQVQNSELSTAVAEKDAEIKRLNNIIKDYEGMLTKKSDTEIVDDNKSDVVSASEYDTDDLTFVTASLCSIDVIAKINGCERPENVPSKNIIVIDTEDGYVTDQYGKTICISYLNNIPMDDLWVNKVKLDTISFGTYDDVNEEDQEAVETTATEEE